MTPSCRGRSSRLEHGVRATPLDGFKIRRLLRCCLRKDGFSFARVSGQLLGSFDSEPASFKAWKSVAKKLSILGSDEDPRRGAKSTSRHSAKVGCGKFRFTSIVWQDQIGCPPMSFGTLPPLAAVRIDGRGRFEGRHSFVRWGRPKKPAVCAKGRAVNRNEEPAATKYV